MWRKIDRVFKPNGIPASTCPLAMLSTPARTVSMEYAPPKLTANDRMAACSAVSLMSWFDAQVWHPKKDDQANRDRS